MVQTVKNPSAIQETWVKSLGWEDPLAEGMASHSNILAWRIPMDREAWRATIHGIAESDMIEWLSMAQHIHFKMITMVSLIRYVTSYWLYSLHCTFHTCSIYFATESCYLNLTHLFLTSTHPLPSGNHLFVLCIHNCFCFVMFVLIFCLFVFLDSLHKQIFVFLYIKDMHYLFFSNLFHLA